MRIVPFASVIALCFCLLGDGCSRGITRTTAANVFFVRGQVIAYKAGQNKVQAVGSKSAVQVGDIVRTSEGASINMMLIPGVFVQVSGNSEIKLEHLTVTKDGNETTGGMLDRRAFVRLNRGTIVSLFSQSARNATEFGIVAGQVTLKPDSNCLFSVWTDGTTTRATCGRGEVNFSVDQQPRMKIGAGYFSEWPTASMEPNAATAEAVAQRDVKKALDVELELVDEAAGWQNRRVF